MFLGLQPLRSVLRQGMLQPEGVKETGSCRLQTDQVPLSISQDGTRPGDAASRDGGRESWGGKWWVATWGTCTGLRPQDPSSGLPCLPAAVARPLPFPLPPKGHGVPLAQLRWGQQR